MSLFRYVGGTPNAEIHSPVTIFVWDGVVMNYGPKLGYDDDGRLLAAWLDPLSLRGDSSSCAIAVFRKGRGVMQRVGIVGDFNPDNHTHQATNAGLAHSGVRFDWVPTPEVRPERPEDRLGHYDGISVAPSSPYWSMEGALAAIRLARERGVPLVGTS